MEILLILSGFFAPHELSKIQSIYRVPERTVSIIEKLTPWNLC